ncbi:MAG: hypothetical protein HZA93_17165 [Verrucomicrobia bacterium]|nr:hypothetical protein [Verrucomicrobiota bacterium]
MNTATPASGTRPRASWQTVGEVGLCGLLAGLADWFAPTIFTGHTLVLGIVFYWIARRRIGPHAALLPLLVNLAVLWFKWSQPYSASLMILEGLWVAWRWEKGRNPLIADVEYWLLFGTPMSWFLYRFVYVIPSPSFEEALVVQVVNGLVAIWVAVVVVGLLPTTASAIHLEAPQSFRRFLVHRLATFGVFPVLIAGMLVVRQTEKSAIADAKERLAANAGQIAGALSRVLAADLDSVRAVAQRVAQPKEFGDPSHLQEVLGLALASGGRFATMLAADASGTVVARAASARFQNALPATARRSVADRDYFSVPISSGHAYLSGPFRGRGYSSELLVAASAPVVAPAGRRIGVIEGSILTSTLTEFLRTNTPGPRWRALLVDRSLLVVASHGFELTPLQTLKGTPLRALVERPNPTPSRFTDYVGADRVSLFSITVPVPDTNWSLTLQRPWGDVTTSVMRAYATLLGIAALAGMAAVIFTTWSIRDMLNAWSRLLSFARDPLSRVGDLNRFNHLQLPVEFQELKLNLVAMAERLASEKQQREALLAELESRVQARTAQLERALVAAQAADRAKSAFLATVSHELRTPLTSIITGTTLLKRSTAGKSGLEVRTLATLEKSSQVLMNVISDVLDFSKLEAGGVTLNHRPFRPAALLADVVLILTPNAQQAGLVITHEARSGVDLVWSGDDARIRQILVNLAGNAVKFTAAGTVRLSSWVAEATPRQSRRLYFSVQDSGPGIPADRQASIFEPFVQLETNRVLSQAGTGLGLSICRKLVGIMGGEITVASQPGAGATFAFWLPDSVPLAAEVPDATEPPRPA